MHLTVLNNNREISANQLNGSIPADIGSLAKLTVLYNNDYARIITAGIWETIN